VRDSWGARRAVARDNVRAAARLLAACLRRPARMRPKVVVASSSSVYGSAGRRPSREDDPPNPASPYAASKVEVERLAAAAARDGLRTVLLRYFSVYGPRQRPDMAFHRFAEAALHGRPLPVFGDGLRSRSFTHVRDVVSATLAAAAADLPSGIAVNVGHHEPVTVRDAIAMLTAALGVRAEIRRETPVAGDAERTWADTARARRLLGWTARTSLAEGLADQIAWHRRRPRGGAGRMRHRAAYVAFDRFPSSKGSAVHIAQMADELFTRFGGGLLGVLGDADLPRYQREETREIARFDARIPNLIDRAASAPNARRPRGTARGTPTIRPGRAPTGGTTTTGVRGTTPTRSGTRRSTSTTAVRSTPGTATPSAATGTTTTTRASWTADARRFRDARPSPAPCPVDHRALPAEPGRDVPLVRPHRAGAAHGRGGDRRRAPDPPRPAVERRARARRPPGHRPARRRPRARPATALDHPHRGEPHRVHPHRRVRRHVRDARRARPRCSAPR